jgi:cold shock CspA family protein
MKTPLEIGFHNLTPSPSLEADIRGKVAKLEKIYPRLIGCRVSVEARHKQHRTGNIYEVHIEMRVPRRNLVVSHEPRRVKSRYARPTVRTSVRDAFRTAEGQLKEFKEQQRGEVKAHAVPYQGEVRGVDRGNGRGFLVTNEGKELYFHRNSVISGDFDKLKRGDAVQYVEAMGDTGPTASKVWVGSSAEE